MTDLSINITEIPIKFADLLILSKMLIQKFYNIYWEICYVWKKLVNFSAIPVKFTKIVCNNYLE